jgi:hypothetical protein
MARQQEIVEQAFSIAAGIASFAGCGNYYSVKGILLKLILSLMFLAS